MKTKGILTPIRKSVWTKAVALKLIMLFLVQMVPFTQSESYALTSGPGQQEYASFEPASTSDMVDLYSGGFTYNIPIMNIPGPNGGYPINLAYHSGVGMDEEASWVGLGWTLNVGAINRMLQGVPDDINGENITYEMHQKESKTASINSDWLFNQFHQRYLENYGVPNADLANFPDDAWMQSFSSQIYFNNYRGFGYRVSYIPSFQKETKRKHLRVSGQLDLSYDSQNGIGISPSLQLSEERQKFTAKQNFGLNYNSGTGINSFSFTNSFGIRRQGTIYQGEKWTHSAYDSQIGVRSSISYQYNEGVQKVRIPSKTNYLNLDMKLPGEAGPHISPNYAAGSFRIDFPFNWQITLSNTSEEDLQGFGEGIVKYPGYGSLYVTTVPENGLLDYTRSSNSYNKKTPFLPSSKTNEDAFSVSGQGTGGMFMATHNKILSYSDPAIEAIDKSWNVTAEIGKTVDAPLTSIHLGVDGGFNRGVDYTGRWQNGAYTSEEVSATPNFKFFGEQSGRILNNDNLAGLGGDQAVRYEVQSDEAGYMDREYEQVNNLRFDQSNSSITSAPTSTGSEIKRASVIKYLTDFEAERFGISRIQSGNCSVKYYDETLMTDAWVNKDYSTHNSSHISEIQVLQQDGSRYVYALPAYNYNHIDVTTGVVENLDHNSNIVDITEDEYDNTPFEHFSKTAYPSYAHSWLLTSVISSDYIDSDNIPGPSDGDMGYWVKINYVKKSGDYAWRVPYEGGFFTEGNKGDISDNMGTFSHGTKDLFYIHSIETKTHIAIFELDSRWDGKSAYDDYAVETDPSGSGQTYRLKSVKLFLKREYMINEGCAVSMDNINEDAKPLQTVEFEHDWSLCQNVPNNNNSISGQKGKLTLKSIFFKSENSERGELSPYKFTYSSNNPDYETRNMDRWGNYKNNVGEYDAVGGYPYSAYPYTEDPDALDSDHPTPSGDEWALTNILLPTGSEIDIEYDPNDYRYVEDEKAMKMLDIIGVGNRLIWVSDHYEMDDNSDQTFPNQFAWFDNPNFGSGIVTSTVPTFRNNTDSVYTFLENQIGGNGDGYRIFFELDHAISASEISSLGYSSPTEYVFDRYVRGMDSLFFSNFTVLRNIETEGGTDYVRGFAPLLFGDNNDPDNYIDDPLYYGLCKVNGNSDYQVGYLTLKRTKLNRSGVTKCNPMTRMAIEHLQLQRPDIVNDFVPNTWDDNNTTASNLVLVVGSILGAFDEAIGMVVSYNLWAFTKGFGKYMQLNGKSKIRLIDPDMRKQGGGGRVSKIVMKDNWINNDDVTNLDKSEYGLAYFYDTNGDGTGYTTGVAYEPQSGKEESALYQPVSYKHSTLLKTEKSLFVELPHLENYYPGASIGYGKVTVKSISPEQSSGNNEHSVAPISVYEFYTPKDFPVYGDETDLSSDKGMLSVIPVPAFYTEYRYKKARTQGYSIVKNDMAGKLKKVSQFARDYTSTTDEPGDFISSQEYVYNTQENNPKKLSSKVQVLSVNNETSETYFQTAILGEDVKMFNERNENRYNDFGFSINFNLELSSLAPAPPFPIPFAFASISRSELSFKTLVTHKIIHRSGILQKVITKTDNSTVVTENIAFDIETGQPLLTKVYNQYEDPIYSLSHPAHWYYPNMGAAHKNEELRLDSPFVTYTASSGGIDVGSTNIGSFTIGDELFLDYASISDVIVHVVDIVGNVIYCIDKNGALIDNGTVSAIKMKASGFKNHLGVAAGGITAKNMTGFDNSNHTSAVQFALSKLLNASAVEFSDAWQMPCYDCEEERGLIEENDPINPFIRGIRGLWRVKRSYAYNTDRIYQDNSKEDGVFADYEAFPWLNPSSKSDKWVLMNTVTKYSPFGFELENKDALGNYSSALYGYDNSLVTAIASNSKYTEMFFDGFEDYYTSGGSVCQNCKNDHFRFGQGSAYFSTDEAHSGNYSFKVTSALSPAGNYSEFTDTLPCPDGYTLPYKTAIPESHQFAKDHCDCMDEFSPSGGKEYVISAWLKHDWGYYYGTPVSYDNDVYIKVSYYSGAGSPLGYEIIEPDSKFKIIDGWQKMENKLTIPSATRKIQIQFYNTTGTASTAYFDDVRMHPFDGNMNSYVYDRATMKLMAELDANNYATFYVYDEAGNLVKMKKETEKGIKTITEGRKDIPKTQ